MLIQCIPYIGTTLKTTEKSYATFEDMQKDGYSNRILSSHRDIHKQDSLLIRHFCYVVNNPREAPEYYIED